MPPYTVVFSGRHEQTLGPYRLRRFANDIANQVYGRLDEYQRAYTGWAIVDLNPYPPGKRVAVFTGFAYRKLDVVEKVTTKLASSINVSCWICLNTDHSRMHLEETGIPTSCAAIEDTEMYYPSEFPRLRNAAILDLEPNLILIFGGGPVTDDLASTAKKSNIPVRRIR